MFMVTRQGQYGLIDLGLSALDLDRRIYLFLPNSLEHDGVSYFMNTQRVKQSGDCDDIKILLYELSEEQ